MPARLIVVPSLQASIRAPPGSLTSLLHSNSSLALPDFDSDLKEADFASGSQGEEEKRYYPALMQNIHPSCLGLPELPELGASFENAVCFPRGSTSRLTGEPASRNSATSRYKGSLKSSWQSILGTEASEERNGDMQHLFPVDDCTFKSSQCLTASDDSKKVVRAVHHCMTQCLQGAQ